MLRIPGSINSKNGQTVRIIKRWNGYRPSIKSLLEDFYVYLCDQRIKELNEQKSRQTLKPKQVSHSRRIWSPNSQQASSSFPVQQSNYNHTIQWIEKLLQTPIADYRKLAIWRIFVPYLLNIRGLSPDDIYSIISEWLDECNQLRRLNFNSNHRIKSALNNSRDFLPISCDKLKVENKGLYNLLQDNGVLTK